MGVLSLQLKLSLAYSPGLVSSRFQFRLQIRFPTANLSRQRREKNWFMLDIIVEHRRVVGLVGEIVCKSLPLRALALNLY